MIERLHWKKDFARTIERFEAWWGGEMVDRPPVTLSVRATRPFRGPDARHATHRDRWLDVPFVVESGAAWMEQRNWVADAIPIFWPNLGPVITAALFGCQLEFDEGTSWARPVVHQPEDWSRIAAWKPDWANACWQVVERMTDYAISASDGRFVVGLTDLHGNYDILAALRDPEALCMDIVDCPDLVRAAGRRAAEIYAEAFERLYARVAAAGFGSTTWTPMYHRGPAYVPSCDFWCMVSPQVAREMIWPDIVREMEPLERGVFHLDGPQALKHLDILVESPKVDAVQWVYGEGQGRAANWMDVYRRIRAAGKAVQVFAADARDALEVLDVLGGAGVWLHVGGEFVSVMEAQEFLALVERRANAPGGRA